MKRILHALVLTVVIVGLVGCANDSSTTSADTLRPENLAKAAADSPKPAAPVKITVPSGTRLRVALLDAVSSDKSRAGDQFTASLTEPVVVDGKTVLAKGTRVRGRVVSATESGRVKGRASLQLTLTQISRNDDPISISTDRKSVV